jgi:GAF domain-containing protein
VRRHGTESRKSVKTRRRKITKAKPRSAAARRGHSTVADLKEQLERQARELEEAREQQTATADVLKVISRSTFDLQAVLNTLIESAARLCGADMGYIARPKADGSFRQEATYGFSPALKEYMDRTPIKARRGSAGGHALLERAAIHIPNARTDRDYELASPHIGGFHTLVAAPLMREGVPIGVLVLARRLMRPFSDRQIELVATFAAQAVIAIENVRLLTELRQSLEQQTATADVLRVISSSPGELKPVFHSMLEKATQLCEASFGTLFLLEGESLRRVALHNAPAKYAEFTDKNPLIPYHQFHSRLIETKQAVHVTDMMVEMPEAPVTKFGNARSLVSVPMLKDNELVGAISIYRQKVRPFTDKQIELVTNFAAQAVIAIENARCSTSCDNR